MHLPDGIIFDDLEPTSTYAVRHWLFAPADPSSQYWDGRHGTLVIVQGRSGKPDTKRDRGLYAVQEFINPGAGGRHFHLAKLDDPPAEGETTPAAIDPDDKKKKGAIHAVYLGDGVLPPRCDCDAGKAGLPNCKHRDALAAVIAKGGLPAAEFAAEGEEP